MDDRLLAQSVYASLSRADLQNAGRFLKQMKKALQKDGRRLSMSHYHYLSSYYHLEAGDLEMARQHGHTAVDINREVGSPYPEALAGITMAQIRFEMGEAEAGINLLTGISVMAEDMQSRTLQLLSELTFAWFEFQQGQSKEALTHLQQGLMIQRKIGFLNIPGWRNSMMKPLLLEALEKRH